MDHDTSGVGAGNPLMPAHSTDIKPVTPGLQAWTPNMPHSNPATPDQPPANQGLAGGRPNHSPSSFQSLAASQAAVSDTPMPAASGGFMGGSFAVPDEPRRPAPGRPSAPFDTMAAAPASGFSPNDQPMPVVKVLSVRGVEYFMMMVNLWIADAALLWIVLALFNGQVGFSILAFPIATLLVTGPLFAYLFLRLKKAELLDPSLRFDPSKRRTTQITQVFTFIVCIANLIGFVYVVINKMGGGGGMSIGKAFLNMLAILLVVGGIFAYYWVDEHRARS